MSTLEGDRALVPVIQLNPETLEVIGTIAGYFDGETLTPNPEQNCWVFIRRDEDNGTFHLCAMATEPPPDFKPLLIATNGDFGQACVAVSNFVRNALFAKHARNADLVLGSDDGAMIWKLWKMTIDGIDGETMEVYFQFGVGESELFQRFTTQRDGAAVEQARSLLGRSATALGKRLRGKSRNT